MRVHQNTCGECHRCRKWVMRFCDSLCMADVENRLGMLADVQACWHDSTVHVQSFSCPKGEADDHDIIR